MNQKFRIFKTEHGQSLMELAFSLMFLLVLLSGVVDLGRAFFTYMAMRDAAQEGALYGSIHPGDQEEVKNHVLNSSDMMQTMIPRENITVTITGSACTGNAISVALVNDNFNVTMPFMGTFLGRQTVTIRASVTDTILTPACKP
jgi:Flp pilus assembly protein TadG